MPKVSEGVKCIHLYDSRTVGGKAWVLLLSLQQRPAETELKVICVS
jgi:hypothetical protein